MQDKYISYFMYYVTWNTYRCILFYVSMSHEILICILFYVLIIIYMSHGIFIDGEIRQIYTHSELNFHCKFNYNLNLKNS